VLMSPPGCAEFRVHHARHQRLPGSIVIAPSNPRLPESISEAEPSPVLFLLVTTSVEGAVSMPKPYLEELRRKVRDLVAAAARSPRNSARSAAAAIVTKPPPVSTTGP
jgi:hypothetical protein